MSLPRQKPKLWLEECSPDDAWAKTVQQRMGIPATDYQLSLQFNSRAGIRLGPRLWPKHTGNEIKDPAFSTCARDPCDTNWSVRYKAFACFDRDPIVITKSEIASDVFNNLDGLSDDRLRNDQITEAQQIDLYRTLQLSGSDDSDEADDSVEISTDQRTASVNPPTQNVPSVPKKGIPIPANVLEEKLPSLPPFVSPLPFEPAPAIAKPPEPTISNSDKRARQNAEAAVNSKPRKRGLEQVDVKPSLYSPLAVKVTDPPSTAGSNHNHHSTDSVSALASLPVQRLSNQENVPTPVKPTDPSSILVYRVLADADAFCRPLQHLPHNLGITLASGGRDGNCERTETTSFALKPISPLPEAFATLGKPVEDIKLSPPKKPRAPIEVKLSSAETKPIVESGAESQEVKPTEDFGWILPSLDADELRARIPPLLPSSNTATLRDRLTSLRFLLRGLRLPNSSAQPAKRSFKAVLLSSSSSWTKEATPPPAPPPPVPANVVFVENGVGTTPRHYVAGCTQFDAKLSYPATASVGVNTDPVRRSPKENGFSADLSAEFYAKKLADYNHFLIDCTYKSFQGSIGEKVIQEASNLEMETTATWSQLVRFVAATSKDSSGSTALTRSFVCSCQPESQRLVHSLFCQTEFPRYPEKALTETRMNLVGAITADTPVLAKRRYERVLEVLTKVASRMQRAESKLLRRAWNALQQQLVPGGGGELPYSSASELSEDAKRWFDLWYSALARVKAVVSDKCHQLTAEREAELRKKILEDESLKNLNLLNPEDDLLTSTPPQSSTSLLNGRGLSQLLSTDSELSNSSGMCTVPRATLERLMKVFQITSMAERSMNSRRESELLLPTDDFSLFACEDTTSKSLSTSSSSGFLPVFVGCASRNMTPLVVYLDNVMHQHHAILSRLVACPQMSQYQRVSLEAASLSSSSLCSSSFCSTPQSSSKRNTAAVAAAAAAAGTVKDCSPFPHPLSLAAPTAKRRNKSSRPPLPSSSTYSPPPPPNPPPAPAFEDLPIRPSRPSHKEHRSHRSRKSSSQSDEASLPPLKKQQREKHQKRSKSKRPEERERRMEDVDAVVIKRRRNHNSRSSSVAPSRRHRQLLSGSENSEVERGEAEDEEENRRGKERKRTRGRSVAPPSVRSKLDLLPPSIPPPLPPPPPPPQPVSNGEIETYSPRKNSSLSSTITYSPSHVEGSAGGGGGSYLSYQPTYIPSMTKSQYSVSPPPPPPPTQQHQPIIPPVLSRPPPPLPTTAQGSGKRVLLQDLPSKPPVGGRVPGFYDKWVTGTRR